MAAPSTAASKASDGKFAMNKLLSDDTDGILRLQGISWFIRRALSMFSFILYIKHTTDEAGIEHIDIDQTVSGIHGNSESYTLNWQEHEDNDSVLGAVIRRSRRIPVEEVTDEFLKKGWTDDTNEHGLVMIETWSIPGKNEYEWKAVQAWGFAMVNNERRYVRHTVFTSSRRPEPIHARIVYEYIGPA